MHAMQQPIPMSTGTQTELSTVLLTHYRSSVSYNQLGSNTKRCGTPVQSNRFTLHCQSRDQVFWQYTTTWYRNNRFIDTSVVQRSDITSRFEAKRHTRCYWTVCTLFNEHGWGLDHTKLRGSGRTTNWNSMAQGRRRGHGLDTKCALMRTNLPESWHNTPSQYIECTCKLTTNISTMTNNIMTINQVNAIQEILVMR